jgi:TRAP-type C4-dicarboxylate transport system permease small subunit
MMVRGQARRVVYLIADATLLAFLLVAALTSLLLAVSTFDREATLPATRLPLGLIYLAMPVGFGLSAANAVERLLLRALNRDLPKDPDQLEAAVPAMAAGAPPAEDALVR